MSVTIPKNLSPEMLVYLAWRHHETRATKYVAGDKQANEITNLICRVFNVTWSELKGKDRRTDITTARHIAMFLIRRKTGLAVHRIGKKFNRDHTTVLSACNLIQDLIDIDDPKILCSFQLLRTMAPEGLLPSFEKRIKEQYSNNIHTT